jgi:mono/diheme cytochrome c family protein
MEARIARRSFCSLISASMFPARRNLAVLLLLLVFVRTAGCYETQGERQRAVAQGRVLFQVNCCGCHNGKRSDLAKTPPNLAGIFQRQRLPSGAPATDPAVRSTILVGRSHIMPSFEESLSDKNIDEIIRYLHSAGTQTNLCATN